MNSLKLKYFSIFLFLVLGFASKNIEAQTIYVTETGKKYHLESCRYLNESKFVIELSEATAKDYTACKVCKPSGLTSSKNTETPASGSSISSVRCSATTQAGTHAKEKPKILQVNVGSTNKLNVF